MVTASISSDDTYSEVLIIPAGTFNLSIWGTFSATVTVQRTFDDGDTWLDVRDFTSNGEWFGTEGEGSKYRIGIKSGNYTSGTVNLRMAV